MNLPNKITIFRMLLVPIFVLCFFSNFRFGFLASVVIFIIASVTDTLDGYIARKRNQVTNFGTLMDPLADKLLVVAALISFVERGLIRAWFAIFIISRELLVTGIRMLACGSGVIISAGIWGKIKTISQIIAIILVFIDYGFVPLKIFNIDFLNIFGFLVFLVTFYSGFDYVKKNLKLIVTNA